MTPPAVLARVLVVGILAFSRGTVTAAAVPAGTINSSVDVEDDDVFVVRSAADAARLARAASRDGAVVDATWVGSVMLDKPIKVRHCCCRCCKHDRRQNDNTTLTPPVLLLRCDATSNVRAGRQAAAVNYFPSVCNV